MLIHKEDGSRKCNAPDDETDRSHQKLPEEAILLSWSSGLSDRLTLLYDDLVVPDDYFFFLLLDVNLFFQLLIVLHRFL